MKNFLRFIVGMAAVSLLAACGNTATPSAGGDVTIKLLAHESFVVSDKVLAEFKKETGITVEVVTAGDAGTMVAGAVLAAGNPTADVLFGIDNTLMPNALRGDGIFEEYSSPALADVRDDVQQWTETRVVTPIDYADVCVNVDMKWFAQSGLPVPASIDVLTLPEYKNLLVIEDPAASSPGLAFLLAVHARMGADGEAWWSALKNNGVKVAASWSDAYFNDFTGGGGAGKYPMVVSYATSPVAEYVYAAEPKPTAVSTAVVTEGCFRQIEYAGVLRGTEHPAEARKVVDWMVSKKFQDEVATNMFVFPALKTATIPDEFTKFSGVVSRPGVLPTNDIESAIPTLLEQWNRVMTS
ncbi:MAG: hypothetical protein RL441_74 [Actinomycetota bacterium]|jgi:thiamine transport system substrate-binding protein